MKKERKTEDLNEIKTLINKNNRLLTSLNATILNAKKGEINMLHSIKKERELLKQQRMLIIKSHTIENKLIDLGRGSAFGLCRIPSIKTNQYSN